MMMLKMQQEQAKNRMSIPPGGQLPPRGMGNPSEVQRLPVSQQGNMPVMISLQGHGGVPQSPDKARGMPLNGEPTGKGYVLWYMVIIILAFTSYNLNFTVYFISFLACRHCTKNVSS